MNLLLDTHILIWAISDNHKLSSHARKLILDSRNSLFFSVVSLWEIGLKSDLHPDEFDFSSEEVFRYGNRAGYRLLTLSPEDIFLLPKLKRNGNAPAHKDPFDRILLCQSKGHGFCFITHDRRLTEYDFSDVILV